MPGPLQNAKHERFCREYAAGETIASAYIRAGYKDSHNAAFNGSRLRNTSACRARIDELMAQFADQAAVKVSYLQAQLLPLLQVSAQDLFDERGKLRPIADLRRELGAAIKSIKFDRKTGRVSEVVLPDKVAVVGLLLKSIGAVSDGVRLSVFTGLDGVDDVAAIEADLARAIELDRRRQRELEPSTEPLPEPEHVGPWHQEELDGLTVPAREPEDGSA